MRIWGIYAIITLIPQKTKHTHILINFLINNNPIDVKPERNLYYAVMFLTNASFISSGFSSLDIVAPADVALVERVKAGFCSAASTNAACSVTEKFSGSRNTL